MSVFLKYWRPNRWRISGVLLLCAISAIAPHDGWAQQQAEIDRAEQRIPFKRAEESGAGLTLRIMGGLLVTVLIGVGAVYGLKRFLPTIYRPATVSGSSIQVLEARRLTPKTTLFLIDVSGTRLLIAQCGDSLTTLHQLPATRPSDATSHV